MPAPKARGSQAAEGAYTRSVKPAALFLLLIPLALAQPPSDEAAVRAIADHWKQAWDKFDASILDGDFTADADWQNAFGIRQKGNAAIVAFVSQVVKRPQLRGRQTTWDAIQVRFLRPDVALAFRDYRTLGHKTSDGRELPERRTHATWVLTKDDGRWRIASQVISDEIAQ